LSAVLPVRLAGFQRTLTLFLMFRTIQNVGTRNIMLTGTHQRQLNLILNIFNMKVPPAG
jgi:hypothetical protein